MQIYYMDHCNVENHLIDKRNHDLDEKMQPLYKTIIDTSLQSKKDCNDYTKKLTAYIATYYSLGDVTNVNVSFFFSLFLMETFSTA